MVHAVPSIQWTPTATPSGACTARQVKKAMATTPAGLGHHGVAPPPNKMDVGIRCKSQVKRWVRTIADMCYTAPTLIHKPQALNPVTYHTQHRSGLCLSTPYQSRTPAAPVQATHHWPRSLHQGSREGDPPHHQLRHQRFGTADAPPTPASSPSTHNRLGAPCSPPCTPCSLCPCPLCLLRTCQQQLGCLPHEATAAAGAAT